MEKKLQMENVMIIILILFISIVIFILIRSAYETRNVAKTEINIAIKGLHKTKRMAFISDFHSASNKKFQDKIIDVLNSNNVEGVFVVGDMIVGKKNADNKPAIDFLKRLCEKYPVYFTYGNHESRMYSRNIEDKSCFFEEISKIKKLYILNNDTMRLKFNNISVNLYGLELSDEYYKRKNPSELTKEAIIDKLGEKKDGYTILLSHKPDYLSAYHQYGANLVLSGHNHGGTIRLPKVGGLISTSFKLFPKFSSGVFYDKDTIMVLTRGIGTHTINFRLFNMPEVVILNFRPSHNDY